ncbi:MAG: hypothetical protein IJD04_08590 [Desulfovibrionaceae bacterium]|nr:hypothetical protein [Desulfovibrionaceae bacterium]
MFIAVLFAVGAHAENNLIQKANYQQMISAASLGGLEEQIYLDSLDAQGMPP